MGIIKKQGAQNTIIVYFGILIGFASLLFIQPHFLRTRDLGLIRILLSYASLLAAIFPMGGPSIAVKYLPKFYAPEKKHNGFFGLLLVFPLVGIILGCTCLFFVKDWIVSLYIEKSRLFTDYLFLGAPLAIFITLIYTLNSYCNAILKTVFPSFLNDIINRVLLIIVIVLYYFKVYDLNGFVLAFVATYGVQAFLLSVYIFMFGQAGFKPDINYLQEHVGFRFMVRYSLILSFTSVSSVSLKFLDSMFLGKQSLEAVGVYSVAAFIALIIETPLNSLERVANSTISHNLAVNNFEEIKKIYYTSSRYLMLLGGFLSALIVISINDLLLLLPAEYHTAGLVTIIISAGSFINMATGINYPILINSSKYVWGSVFLFILLVLAFVSNYFLVPRYGMLGAAIATAGSSSVYNLLKYFFIWKNFKMQPFN
ncbi:MAG: polysaccharide biosynthesis C-terminal domain-containing protein, partial [Bacteroidia bacterium]|nr:polysaccharide biosynthesis C-terminal domain-containing protein [Bacteroidia bacterium]